MQRLDEEKRQAIIVAAQKRLARHGVKKTTMQEIAKDAGIAVGTLYLYFKNKNEILIATANTYTQQHLLDADKILRANMPADQKLKAYLLNRFRAVQEIHLSGSHAAELARTVMALQPELKAAEDLSVTNNVQSILQEGIREKLFEIKKLDRDLQVFLCSIGIFFPIPTTEQYYEPDKAKLCLVIDWFIEKWSAA
ncbi:MAG: helix-turn-helix domain-containing protein [Cyanobacteria bacterium P01_A01_bin.114]